MYNNTRNNKKMLNVKEKSVNVKYQDINVKYECDIK